MLTRQDWPLVGQHVTVWTRSGRELHGVVRIVSATTLVLTASGPTLFKLAMSAVEGWSCLLGLVPREDGLPSLATWHLWCSNCRFERRFDVLPGLGVDLQRQAILRDAHDWHFGCSAPLLRLEHVPSDSAAAQSV